VSGNISTIATTINSNSAATETALENTLSRDGTLPNQMMSDLDMNSNQILNLPFPSSPNSPVRLIDIESTVGSPSLITFDTLAQFKATTESITSSYIKVNAVTGTYPAADGLEATPLTYKAITSTLGLYGEITVAGQLYAPIYSTNPVNMGEFGIVPDASFAQGTNYITATANGTTTLTTSNTAGVTVGANIANLSWHSFAAAAVGNAGVIPIGTTVISFVPNVSITLSNPVVAASNLALMWWTESLTGTDNIVAMQAAIDFAMQNGYTDITIPLGKYLISDTLHAGWGDGFYQIHIRGIERMATGFDTGVNIYTTKTDRPCLSLQGTRSASVQGIAFIGRMKQFTEFAQGFSHLLSSDPLDWVDPRFVPTGNNPGGLQLSAPWACITQDAYSGSQPTIHYPNRTYPAWVIAKGYSTQYGGAFSSNILIQDCSISGFAALIVSGINTDSQGDFLKMNRLSLEACAYGASIGNNQSRNVLFENIDAARYHTLFSGTNLGKQDGEIVGPLDNISGGNAYQFFDFTSLAITGTLTIKNLYCEDQIRIGNMIGGTSIPGTIIFKGGFIDCQTISGRLPASLLTMGQFGQVVFDGTTIDYTYRIANIANGGGVLKLMAGGWNLANVNPSTVAQQRAINYCGGFLAGTSRFNALGRNNFKVDMANMSYYPTLNAGITNLYHDDEIKFLSSAGALNRSPMTQAAKRYVDQQHRQWRMTVPPEVTISITPGYSNDVMTFSYASGLQTNVNVMYNLTVGDMLYHPPTGTIFVITAIGSVSGGFYPITTQQQNNITVDSSNNFQSQNNTDTTLVGGVIIVKTEAVIPATLEYATFASGSGNLTNISDGTGTSSMAGDYVNGDYFFGVPNPAETYRQWPVTAGSTISAIVDGTPGTATLSANAIVSGRFPLFPYELY
jgi:hypothetical protein